ncbi:uncharacterized protein N7458_005363 [Penicillium daleae]|uniref:Uncharacterized protein n=1 Tax=Penicillium daleae TaxID=63821 RepID=A0AAD6G4A6_9EURO|nr:uncharacterized protein N7458_005363 [Penicillium daleae]KAJ5454407.1 hypothetical protein N7458_005363 [Penicillium daleae]
MESAAFTGSNSGIQNGINYGTITMNVPPPKGYGDLDESAWNALELMIKCERLRQELQGTDDTERIL